MPFRKIYAFDFTNQQLTSSSIASTWPSPQIAPTPNSHHNWTPAGLDLTTTRPDQATSDARTSVCVVPPGGIKINTRLLMKVTFLHPNAIGLNGDHTKIPTTWAVGLRYSSDIDILDGNKCAIATCQFLNEANSNGGRLITVRVNYPNGEQNDPALPLESHSDYSSFNPVQPHPNTNPAVVPRITLEHSFSGHNLPGFNLPSIPHTTGAGFLTIARRGDEPVSDHRVNSRAEFPSGSTKIKALGVNLACTKGNGSVSVRLLKLEVWQNDEMTP